MSLLDSIGGGLQDIGDSFEGFNHAPVDNTMRYGDNHGEATTKATIIAGLLYGMGGYGGESFGGESNLGMGGGGGAGGGGSGGALSQYGGSALNNIKGMFGGLGGMGGGGQQQPRFNPFSPAQPMPADSPYHPMQFQNQSFVPWEQNVASMGMPKQQQILGPQHIFGQGQGFF